VHETDVTYEFRLSLARSVQHLVLTPEGIAGLEGTIPFGEIVSIRLYSLPGMSSLAFGTVAQPVRRCNLQLHNGKTVLLCSSHYVSLGNFEDRTESYRRFVAELLVRLRAANPAAQILSGMPPGIWWGWFLTFGGLSLILAAAALMLCVGVAIDRNFSWGMLVGLALLLLMLWGPLGFLRATWRRRSMQITGDITQVDI
jgi:hypothetical protein